MDMSKKMHRLKLAASVALIGTTAMPPSQAALCNVDASAAPPGQLICSNGTYAARLGAADMIYHCVDARPDHILYVDRIGGDGAAASAQAATESDYALWVQL